MQIGSTPSITRAPAAPSAGDTTTPEAAGGSSFAGLLSQQQTRETAQADTSDRSDRSDTDHTGCAEAQGDAQAAQTRGARVRTPGKPAARATERSVAHKADTKAEQDPVDGSRRDEPGTGSAADPTLRDWMAALHLPSHVPPAAGGGALAVDGGASAPTVRGTALLDADAPAAQALAPIADSAAPREAPGGLRATAPDKSSALAQRVPSGQAAPAGPEPAAANPVQTESARFSIDLLAGMHRSPADAAALPMTAPAPTGASDRSATSAVSVPMAMPIDDPQFPRAFGVQVSVLARDGVQQAELHLNPAEMGPVSIQIVMEGTQARIDFGADAAGTRQLIEHSLPELAAALREAGLTLTGGGVSQHSSGRDDGTGASAQERTGGAATPATGADTATRPLRRNVRAGGVDLYA